ncbi:MAG: response regulator transcription factor [Acidobacteria bacterium]|nr:response regulator transcription factor [Acidobacteriota bacterium]
MDVQSRSKSGQDVWISITTVSILSPRRKLAALVHLFRNLDRTQALPPSKAGLDSPSSVDVSSPLSRRELTVLRLLAEGLGTKEIGARLFISPKTVKNHSESILRKLQVHSRLEAVLWALHHRLV